MERKYRVISYEKFPSGNTATAYEKVVGCFTFTLDSHEGENYHGVNLRISKGEEFIAAIKSSYFPDVKQLTIEDMGTHPGYRQIGLGKIRLGEVLSFLISKGQTPQTIVAEGVDNVILGEGEKFVKALGFQHVGNRSSWQVSFEELNKRLEKK